MSRPEFTCHVATRFLPEQSDPNQAQYGFAYTITIRNTGDCPAQLIARQWIITDGTGHREEVRGLGVIGRQPLLAPGEQFEYSSWTRIGTPRGQMEGSFFCITDEARWFDVPIAPFELSMANALH